MVDRPGCRYILCQPSTAHVAMLVESGVGGRPGPGQSASPATSHWNGIGHRGSGVGRTCSPLVFRGSPLAGLMSCSAAPVKINPSPNSHSPPASYHPLHQRSLDCSAWLPPNAYYWASCMACGSPLGAFISSTLAGVNDDLPFYSRSGGTSAGGGLGTLGSSGRVVDFRSG